VVLAHRLLAVSYYLTGEVAAAETEFVALLGYRPDARLDPLVDPPAAVAFFDRVRRQVEARLGAVREREREEERRRQAEEERRRREAEEARQVAFVERTVVRRPYGLNFVPFGVGQFQNGQAGKGVALLVTESVLAISSIALWSVFQYRFPGGRVTPAHEEQANWLRWSHVGTGAAFFAVALCGMIDAMVNFRREEVIERELPGRPAAPRGAIPGAAPQAPPAGPRSSRWQTPGRRPRVGVSPAAGPGFLGASLGGTF
jgi:hypothetical protein